MTTEHIDNKFYEQLTQMLFLFEDKSVIRTFLATKYIFSWESQSCRKTSEQNNSLITKISIKNLERFRVGICHTLLLSIMANKIKADVATAKILNPALAMVSAEKSVCCNKNKLDRFCCNISPYFSTRNFPNTFT